MLTAYVIGVVVFPFLIGGAARIKGKELCTDPKWMTVTSLLWPAFIWGVLAATIADTVANR